MNENIYLNGTVMLIDKPLNWTSFDVVNKLRWKIKKSFRLRKIKVGHAGTLDPLATGLLIICTGKYTKQIESYQSQEKEYTGTLVLGATRPSYDMETEIDETYEFKHISEEEIKKATKPFTGTIMQTPPIFSAKKINGIPAYEYARKGKPVEVKSREITISEFEITEIDLPNISFRVVCSKGTYIRSLAHDFGKTLQSGAYLSALCRTRIGNFSLTDSKTVDQANEEISKASQSNAT